MNETIRRLYRPALRLDGLWEIFMYSDDPGYEAALKTLERRTFAPLSAGYIFVGRPEDFAKFEAAICRGP